MPTHRPGQATPPPPRRTNTGQHPRHGHDQRTAGRGRRPGRARPLGRRPDHRHRTAGQRSAPWSSGPPATCCCCTCPTAATPPASSGPCARPSPPCPRSCAARITWDQGKEMAYHASSPSPPASRSTSATRTSPGSAGSNENTNGLLRQYMPKGTDLSVHTADDLARYRPKPQRPPPQDPRLHETIRTARRAPCAHRLNPPNTGHECRAGCLDSGHG